MHRALIKNRRSRGGLRLGARNQKDDAKTQSKPDAEVANGFHFLKVVRGGNVPSTARFALFRGADWRLELFQILRRIFFEFRFAPFATQPHLGSLVDKHEWIAHFSEVFSGNNTGLERIFASPNESWSDNKGKKDFFHKMVFGFFSIGALKMSGVGN